MAGWQGRVLEVDLAKGASRELVWNQQWARAYLGGRGWGARFFYEEWQRGGLGAVRDMLVLAAGPLTATTAPTAGRVSASFLSPLTGTLCDANAGGQWGVALKRAGWDALVIRGRAPQPVWLAVDESGARLREAGQVWGLDIPAATAALRQLGPSGGRVLCIGPAGEAGVLFASIAVDGHRFLGRGGGGAVLGAQNLKGIVVAGRAPVPVADPKGFGFVVYEAQKQLQANPVTSRALPQFGTAVLVNLLNTAGVLPVRNFQTAVSSAAAGLSGEAISERLLVRRYACYRCPVGCGRVTRTARDAGHGPEYETVWALGLNLGIDDLETVAEANYLCNRLGLDTISTGGTLACAMELTQRGLLRPGLNFGDGPGVLQMLPDLAHRRGWAGELAEGSRHLAAAYGAPECAMQVRGLELPAYDPRGLAGQGLGFATSNRGGCHLRGNMLGPEILGTPKLVDRFQSRGKAGLLIVQQHSSAMLDSLVLCKFSAFALGDEYFARLLSAASGESYSSQDLQVVGERIWNLERLFNQTQGLGASQDTLPRRLLQEPLAAGPARGRVVELAAMLPEYYRFRGWDEQGVPTQAKLAQLGLAVNQGRGGESA